MDVRRTRFTRSRVLLALALLAIAVTACGNARGSASGSATTVASPSGGSGNVNTGGAPGVTGNEVKFGAFGTRSNNPLGTCLLDCFDAGVKAYFAWRNSQGGVNGRKLVLSKEIDDQLGADQQAALQLTSANDVFGAFSAALAPSGYADVAHAGIPLYTYGVNFDQMNGQPGIYGDRPVICVICTSRFFPYVGTLVHAKRIAAIGYGVAAAPKDCVASAVASVKKYAPETGQSISYQNDTLDFGLKNGIGPQVTAMKQAGTDMVATCMDLNGVKTLKQEMKRQGMGNVPVLHNDSYNHEFIRSAGDLFNGDILQTSFRPFEADAAGSQLDSFKQWMAKTNQPLSEIALQGWVNADLAYQGLKAAGKNPTRASVIAATNKLNAFSAGGLISPIDWSRQHQAWTDADPLTHGYVTECRAFLRVDNGNFVLLAPKDTPFACFNNKNQAWTKPTFENVK
jgi:ABC-type branched-subunit amino acid transport system substrate-binding protein